MNSSKERQWNYYYSNVLQRNEKYMKQKNRAYMHQLYRDFWIHQWIPGISRTRNPLWYPPRPYERPKLQREEPYYPREHMLNLQPYPDSYDQDAFPAMNSSDGEGQYLHVSNGPFGAQGELDVEERFTVTSQESRGERRKRVRVKFRDAAITDDNDDAPDFDKMAGKTLQPSSRILDMIMNKIEAPPPSSQGPALRERPLAAIVRPESGSSLFAAKVSRTVSVTSVTQVEKHHQEGEASKRRRPSPAPLDKKSSALSWNWLGGMKSPSLSSEAAAESRESTRSRTTISRTETRCIASEIVDFLQLDAPPRRRRRSKPPRSFSETLFPDLLDLDGSCSSSKEQALATEMRKPMPAISTFPGSLRLDNGEISHEKNRMSFQELRLALPSPPPDTSGKKKHCSGSKKNKPRWNSGKSKKETDKSKPSSHHRSSSKSSAAKKVKRRSKP